MSHTPLTTITYHVLLSLADQELHGYGILKEVESVSGGELVLETGSLYAAIRRLRGDGLIEAAAPTPGADARRKNYRLTPAGVRVLRQETERLARVLEAAHAKDLLRTS
jgi:DNA-binding PadR family transcriptional regulator